MGWIGFGEPDYCGWGWGWGGMDRVRPVVERFSSIEPAPVSDVSTDWSGHPTKMKGSGCQTFKC